MSMQQTPHQPSEPVRVPAAGWSSWRPGFWKTLTTFRLFWVSLKPSLSPDLLRRPPPAWCWLLQTLEWFITAQTGMSHHPQGFTTPSAGGGTCRHNSKTHLISLSLYLIGFLLSSLDLVIMCRQSCSNRDCPTPKQTLEHIPVRVEAGSANPVCYSGNLLPSYFRLALHFFFFFLHQTVRLPEIQQSQGHKRTRRAVLAWRAAQDVIYKHSREITQSFV